jgi:hypothetical protein
LPFIFPEVEEEEKKKEREGWGVGGGRLRVAVRSLKRFEADQASRKILITREKEFYYMYLTI